MSILTEALRRRITFGQAAIQIEAWGSALLSKAPAAVQTDVGAAISDLKQAASNAIQLADTAAGPLIAEGSVAVSTAFTAVLTKYLGPLAAVESPVTTDAVNTVAAALKAEIDAMATQAIASLKPAPAPQPAQQTQQAAPTAA